MVKYFIVSLGLLCGVGLLAHGRANLQDEHVLLTCDGCMFRTMLDSVIDVLDASEVPASVKELQEFFEESRFFAPRELVEQALRDLELLIDQYDDRICADDAHMILCGITLYRQRLEEGSVTAPACARNRDDQALDIETLTVRGAAHISGDVTYEPIPGDVEHVVGSIITGVRAVAGRVENDGKAIGTPDFSVIKHGVGNYSIVFDRSFATSPALAITPESIGFVVARIVSAPSPSSVRVCFTNMLNIMVDPAAFRFVAIGY